MAALRLVACSAAVCTVAVLPAQPGSKEERGEGRSHPLVHVGARLRCAFFSIASQEGMRFPAATAVAEAGCRLRWDWRRLYRAWHGGGGGGASSRL